MLELAGLGDAPEATGDLAPGLGDALETTGGVIPGLGEGLEAKVGVAPGLGEGAIALPGSVAPGVGVIEAADGGSEGNV